LARKCLNNKNVLITGSTGFVGRPLCEKLLLKGYCVRGSVRNAEATANLPAGVQSAPIESIGPDTDWSAALTGIDTVIHLAARVHVMDETAGDPLIAYRQVNVAGTENLARQAAAHGVRRLVFLSSVKVNGEETEIPYSEQTHPDPRDPYGVSKLEAENVLRKVAVETGLEVVIIRPPLVYGPGVKANFHNLLKIVERGVPLPLAGITNARSLIFLGNLIDAIITCATHPQAAGQTFLVSDGEDVSTPQLIRQLATALDRPARLLPFPPSLMRLAGKLTGKSMAVDRLLGSLVVDSGKIRRELGWQPPFSMAEGLAETAKWYKDGMARRGHAEKN
jgi:nucleoside-diphosphate-sugar epimerase